MPAIQGLALATMLVDHLGAVGLFLDWSRLVGRAALPAFVVMIAANAWVVPDPATLLRRLAVLWVISQPLWALSVGSWDRLCILVTLAAVVALVWACRARAWYRGALVLALFVLVAPWVEYGPWPLLLVPLGIWGLSALPLALVWVLVQYAGAPVYQAAALVGVLAIAMLVRFPFNVPRLPRWATRWFYPGHLLGLSIIKMV